MILHILNSNSLRLKNVSGKTITIQLGSEREAVWVAYSELECEFLSRGVELAEPLWGSLGEEGRDESVISSMSEWEDADFGDFFLLKACLKELRSYGKNRESERDREGGRGRGREMRREEGNRLSKKAGARSVETGDLDCVQDFNSFQVKHLLYIFRQLFQCYTNKQNYSNIAFQSMCLGLTAVHFCFLFFYFS